MKIRLVVILAAAVSMGLVSPTNALAQQTDCKSIQDPKARLECFDAAPPKAPTAAPAKSAPKADRNTTAVGGWQLQRSKNAMTDKTDCILVPVGKPHVQITVGDLYISYRGRGGVQGFRYRLDDEPVSQMQLPTEIDKQIGAVHISGDTFNRILQASRLRVEVLTLISGVQNEDLAVAGVRGLYTKMQRECLGIAVGTYLVTISSQRSQAEAQSAFESLQLKFPEQLKNRKPIIVKTSLADHGVFYRVHVGPFTTAEEAGGFCANLKTAGGQCLIQHN